jgi:hypothetical protein
VNDWSIVFSSTGLGFAHEKKLRNAGESDKPAYSDEIHRHIRYNVGGFILASRVNGALSAQLRATLVKRHVGSAQVKTLPLLGTQRTSIVYERPL